MISELFRKWFGLDPVSCETCEILRMQLAESNAERRELLHRLLEKDKPEPSLAMSDEPIPVTSKYIPFRIRQQLLEAEDRAKAKLMREKEIEKLEGELGVKP